MATTITARELLALVDRPMVTSTVVGAAVRAGRPLQKGAVAKRLAELVRLGLLARVRTRSVRHRNGVDVWAPPGSSTEAIQRAAEGGTVVPRGLGFNEHGSPMRMGGSAMACPICCFPDSFAHGRIACRWRRCHNANIVKAMLARAEPPADPDAERLRLAWWVVRRTGQLDGVRTRNTPANFAWRATARAASARAVPGDTFDRVTRDIDRYAANRWALAALEAIEAAPCT